MSRAIRQILPLLLLAFLSGCSGGSFNYNGRWTGHRDIKRPGADPSILATINAVTLTIKDSRFEMISAGIPISGNISFEGEKIELNAQTFMDQDLSKLPVEDAERVKVPMTVKAQKDGSIILTDRLIPDGGAVRLTRDESGKP